MLASVLVLMQFLCGVCAFWRERAPAAKIAQRQSQSLLLFLLPLSVSLLMIHPGTRANREKRKKGGQRRKG
jgi:hypothetical protein